jgi:uncharacterized iron-regulated membrane protein
MRLPFRRMLFWCHLICGVTAGVVVLIMSATGVALTYQRQMQYWADTRDYRALPSPGAVPAPASALVASAQAFDPAAVPSTLTYRADPAAPVAVTLGARTIYLDRYTAAVHGEGRGRKTRQFFSTMTAWHRYLGRTADSRATGRFFTGLSNAMFLFIVVSGLYLWWPKALTWTHIRHVIWLRTGVTGKARDFNWHNAIGFWSALPLVIVVSSGVVLSYPWASDMVYRAMGEAPPAPGGAGRPTGRNAVQQARAVVPAPSSLETAIRRATDDSPDWTTLTVRVPTAPRAPIAVTVDRGGAGQPQKRRTLSIDAASGAVERREHFGSQTPGRRMRTLLRFAHTGEVLGVVGQTIAGMSSFGAVVLVYTGLALSARRLAAWRRRGKRAAAADA